jgi:hypothetical protein
MKNYLKISSLILIPFVLLYVFSCTTGNSTEPENETITFNAYQDGGCNSSPLAKTAVNDSCFSYSFNDTLKIDFCVTANCCPDSQRFVTDFNIKSDTIFVSVADTAARLCHCVCNYTIHLDFVSLSKSQYFFYCNYDDRIVYNESINK